MTQTGGQDRQTRRKGFRQAASLLGREIREAGESRGFAVSRVLTHWADIAGAELAEHTQPVDISYGRDGFGATLTVLTTGAYAPMVDMQRTQLKDRVNACYGYAAIARIKVTQTAPQGFADGRAVFQAAASEQQSPVVSPEQKARAVRLAAPVEDDGLRKALSALGTNIIKRNST